MLRRLRLLLSDWPHYRNQANVDEANVLLADSELELPQSLDERSAFDVPNRPAQLNHTSIRLLPVAITWNMGDSLNPVLDLIRDVWDYLDSLAQVVATPLLQNHALIHLSGGDVILSRQTHV